MKELHFTPTNGPVDDTIERLMDIAGGIKKLSVK
jgi:hypothetical protein